MTLDFRYFFYVPVLFGWLTFIFGLLYVKTNRKTVKRFFMIFLFVFIVLLCMWFVIRNIFPYGILVPNFHIGGLL